MKGRVPLDKENNTMAQERTKIALDSARVKDLNGWVEILGNPISKVGVFSYSGSQIDPEARNENIDPDTIYQVYRSPEELQNTECLESFRLVPIIDDHEMLGSSCSGFTPAENKGVHGTIGENVYFEDGYLKANLKIFSEKLANLIKQGKKELSIGYHCAYDSASGSFDGKNYDFIQRNIRGNHLALVENGRAGSDVAVLDHFVVTLDTRGLIMAEAVKEEEIKSVSLTDVLAELREVKSMLASVKASAAESYDEKEEKDEPEVTSDEDEEKSGKKTEDEKEDDKKEEKREPAMDAAFVARLTKQVENNLFRSLGKKITARDKLASDLSSEIGVFDSANMSLDDVVAYGLKKLGVKAEKGTEHAVLAGYLLGRKSTPVVHAEDTAENRERDVLDDLIGE